MIFWLIFYARARFFFEAKFLPWFRTELMYFNLEFMVFLYYLEIHFGLAIFSFFLKELYRWRHNQWWNFKWTVIKFTKRPVRRTKARLGRYAAYWGLDIWYYKKKAIFKERFWLWLDDKGYLTFACVYKFLEYMEYRKKRRYRLIEDCWGLYDFYKDFWLRKTHVPRWWLQYYKIRLYTKPRRRWRIFPFYLQWRLYQQLSKREFTYLSRTMIFYARKYHKLS